MLINKLSWSSFCEIKWSEHRFEELPHPTYCWLKKKKRKASHWAMKGEYMHTCNTAAAGDTHVHTYMSAHAKPGRKGTKLLPPSRTGKAETGVGYCCLLHLNSLPMHQLGNWKHFKKRTVGSSPILEVRETHSRNCCCSSETSLGMQLLDSSETPAGHELWLLWMCNY
jgi:hypothetical protein